MLKAFNLLEILWDYGIIVTIDMPSLGYYSALSLYSAGKSTLVMFTTHFGQKFKGYPLKCVSRESPKSKGLPFSLDRLTMGSSEID